MSQQDGTDQYYADINTSDSDQILHGTVVQGQLQFDGSNESLTSMLSFVLPNPGDIIDLGTITMRHYGMITGTVKDDEGNIVDSGSLNFAISDSTNSNDILMRSGIDTSGHFTIRGNPNTVYRSMIGRVLVDNVYWKTEVINLPFPDSDEVYDIGTLIIRP